MSDLKKRLMDTMGGGDDLYSRLVEWFGVDKEAARDYIKGLSLSKYSAMMEATVDRNPSLTSGTTTSGDPRYGDEISDIEDLMRNKDSGEIDDKPSSKEKPEGNNFNDFDPDYIPSYIKNKSGEIDYKKIQKGDRIAYVDDYGKVMHGVVDGTDDQGNYDISSHRGVNRSVEKGRLRTPRELAWRYKTKSDKGSQSGKAAAKDIENKISGTMNNMNTLSQQESVEDDEISRMRHLAGMDETASAGATGAGAIASHPSVIGDIDKRPSTDLQVRTRMDRDNKKKRKKRSQGKEVK